MKRRYLATILFLLAVCSPLSLDAKGPDEKGAVTEMFVIGPFPLGDLYKDMWDGDKRMGSEQRITRGGGPARGEIIAALNKGKVSVLHIRKRSAGMWDFVGSETLPRVVVEGTLSFDLKDAKGKDFNIHVKEVGFGSVNYLKAEAKRPRICRLLISARLSTSPYRVAAEPKGLFSDSGLNFMGAPIFVDADNKIWPAEQMKKRP